MLSSILYFLFIYFLLGAILLILINKKNKSNTSKERWTKYVFYLLIVIATIISIQYQRYFLLGSIISVIGLIEIIKISQYKLNNFLPTILFYIPIVALFLYHCQYTPLNWQLFTYTIVIVFDGFAQIIGQLIGKKKILPKTSPNKTVAGLMGGYLCAFLTAYLLAPYIEVSKLQITFFTFLISTAGIVGDLSASFIKRKNKVKDFSRLIPGHGGILDRYDSLIMAGAACFLIIGT